MKKILLFSSILMLLTACPVGLDYAPGETGKELVDKRLEGTWVFSDSDNPSDSEVMKAKFTKRDKYSYNVSVLESGEMYSMETNDYVMHETTIDGLHIMYFKPDGENKYYLYQYLMRDNNTMVIADIPLLDGGIDSIQSTESLRTQIAASMKMENFYQEPKTFKKQ